MLRRRSETGAARPTTDDFPARPTGASDCNVAAVRSYLLSAVAVRCRRPTAADRWRSLAVLAVLLVSLVATATPAVAAPLLSNPGCESGTSGWQPYNATVTATAAVKRSGTRSCRVAATTGPFFSLAAQPSPVRPGVGTSFTATAWVRADAKGGSVFAALRERGGTTADRTVYGGGVTLSTQWQRITVTLKVTGPGRAAVDFYVVRDPGATGQVLYLDDAELVASSTSPSGAAMPVGDLPGWRQVFAEDFTVAAPTGSWGASCAQDPDKIVYTGAGGTKWRTYADCYRDTEEKRPYRSDQVLSVHDGVLDFSLRNVDGRPAGASPSPVINAATNSQYQTYGRYSARFRVDTPALSEYYIAWLLWPLDEEKWKCAESDFPEMGLADRAVNAFAHYGCAGAQDQFSASIDLTKWHTVTQEWAPGVRRYYLDGTLIGTSTRSVFNGPQRFQLQTETRGNGTHAGHLTVDWVVVYAYRP